MYFVESFYFKTVKYNLINKFIYSKQKTIPKLKKISLNFNSKTADIKKLLSSLLAFELVTNQKGNIIVSKTINISIKIRKGNPVSCKLAIKKQNLLKFYSFILFNILVNHKIKINTGIKKNTISYTINDSVKILKLEKYYYFFNTIPKLNITIIMNIKNSKEIKFFFKLFKFF